MNDGDRTATYITPLLECVDMNKATTPFLLDVVYTLVVISYLHHNDPILYPYRKD